MELCIEINQHSTIKPIVAKVLQYYETDASQTIAQTHSQLRAPLGVALTGEGRACQKVVSVGEIAYRKLREKYPLAASALQKTADLTSVERIVKDARFTCPQKRKHQLGSAPIALNSNKRARLGSASCSSSSGSQRAQDAGSTSTVAISKTEVEVENDADDGFEDEVIDHTADDDDSYSSADQEPSAKVHIIPRLTFRIRFV
ncbi:hypothetical protein V1511DRAFT_498109 [Dipodascopsis uninucleata]